MPSIDFNSIKEFSTLSPQVVSTISGAWNDEKQPSWRGHIVAPESIVVLSFLRAGSTLYWVKSAPATEITLSLTLHWLNFDGTQFQLMYASGGSHNEQVAFTAPLRMLKPTISATSAPAGSFVTLFSFDSDPAVAVTILPLARRDVKMGRNGIWRLKSSDHIASLQDPLQSVMAKGRQGSFVA